MEPVSRGLGECATCLLREHSGKQPVLPRLPLSPACQVSLLTVQAWGAPVALLVGQAAHWLSVQAPAVADCVCGGQQLCLHLRFVGTAGRSWLLTGIQMVVRLPLSERAAASITGSGWLAQRPESLKPFALMSSHPRSFYATLGI